MQWDMGFPVLCSAGLALLLCASQQSFVLGWHLASQMEVGCIVATGSGSQSPSGDLPFQPDPGRRESGCCDLPSSRFKCKIQVWALLAFLK